MPRAKPKQRTTAELARARYAELTTDVAQHAVDARVHTIIAAELSRQLGRTVRPSQVRDALKRRERPGPPTHRTDGVVLAVTVERSIADRARGAAMAEGVSIGTWVEDAIAVRLLRNAEHEPKPPA